MISYIEGKIKLRGNKFFDDNYQWVGLQSLRPAGHPGKIKKRSQPLDAFAGQRRRFGFVRI